MERPAEPGVRTMWESSKGQGNCELDQLCQELVESMGHERFNPHRMGQIYNHIIEHRLAEEAGYESARDYFSQRLAAVSLPTLRMYGVVAENFSEAAVRRYGVPGLRLLVAYKEATGMEVDPEAPGATPIEVPDEKGDVTEQPFSQCSEAQLHRALWRKRKPVSSGTLPPEVLELAEKYSEALAASLRKGQGTRVRTAVRNEKGMPVMDFKSVPVWKVPQMAAALLAQAAAEPKNPRL